jgi:excisionase family DNA binding protein
VTWEYKIYRTIGEIAKFLQLSERTVKDLISNKKLPVKRENGTWTMTTKDYDDWRKNNQG